MIPSRKTIDTPVSESVHTIDMADNLIAWMAEHLYDRFSSTGLERIACIFGGRRPGLFLKRALAQRFKKGFIPPRLFSMDEFMAYCAAGDTPQRTISDLDASYRIFQIAGKVAPAITRERTSFARFLPWAREIVMFIEQLDLEDIDPRSLHTVQKSAAIGFEVPESINILLKHITKIRSAYHDELSQNHVLSRGYTYLTAAEALSRTNLDEFDRVIFCAPYYLHATELKVIKTLLNKRKAMCVFQGDPHDWSVLAKNERALGVRIHPPGKIPSSYQASFYQGFDMHSQAGIVREILKKNTAPEDDTVVVLPRPEMAIPLLSEIPREITNCNISLGYPVTRTSLYSLFDLLFRVVDSKRDGRLYAPDYLNILQHPLVKNMAFTDDHVHTQVLVHTVENIIKGSCESSISGCLFLRLVDIENEQLIFTRTTATLKTMGKEITEEQCRHLITGIHRLLFTCWEQAHNVTAFADALSMLLSALCQKTKIESYMLNRLTINTFFHIADEFRQSCFAAETFPEHDIWDLFMHKIKSGIISFSGSPLKGLQILGFLETRTLNFSTIIVVDMNESIMPKLKIYEPLIPREVMMALGLNRLENEEEIQRYHFMRLIAGAQHVHLVFEENQKKERSRFIEELLWKDEIEKGRRFTAPIPRAVFSLDTARRPMRIAKSPRMIEYLKGQTYSPSRINTYLHCSLSFYFQYVLGLKEKEDLLESPEESAIGTYLHELLEETFSQFIGKKPSIDQAFEQYFFTTLERTFNTKLRRRMRSDSYLLEGVIRSRMEHFLKTEKKRDIEQTIELEKKHTGSIRLNNISLKITATIDRIDRLPGNRILIIDYKSGSIDLLPKKFSVIEKMPMTRESIEENIKSFQLPLYHHLVSQQFPGTTVDAALYSLRTQELKHFIPESELPHKQKIMEIYFKALASIVAELFDPDTPFEPSPDERSCRYCSFIPLCKQ